MVQLASELSREVSPAFAQMSEVSDIVDAIEGMIVRG